MSADGPATFSDLVASDAPGPRREAATSEFVEIVAGCMQRLNARPRAILTLRNGRDLSYQEIAALLGISIGTVKSRLTRAREKLRVLLTEASPELGADARPAAW